MSEAHGRRKNGRRTVHTDTHIHITGAELIDANCLSVPEATSNYLGIRVTHRGILGYALTV